MQNGGAIFLNNLNLVYIFIFIEQSYFCNLTASNGGAIFLYNFLN
jgi:hypothetical protein